MMREIGRPTDTQEARVVSSVRDQRPIFPATVVDQRRGDHIDPYEKMPPQQDQDRLVDTASQVGTAATQSAARIDHQAQAPHELPNEGPKDISQNAQSRRDTSGSETDRSEHENAPVSTDSPQDPPIDKPPADALEAADEPEPNVDEYKALGITVLVSREHIDPRLTERLLQENGDFSGWAHVPDAPSDKDYYQDRPDDPEYFAKTRSINTVDRYVREIERMIDAAQPPSEDSDHLIQTRKSILDVRQEFLIADDAERLLATAQVQELAEYYHYKSVTVIKPVAAVENRYADKTTVVYPMQHIDPDLQVSDAMPDSVYQDLVELTYELRDMFERHGIAPVDLSPKQCLILVDENGDRHLKLGDLERYYYLHKLQS
jgi:hypothetical protein